MTNKTNNSARTKTAVCPTCITDIIIHRISWSQIIIGTFIFIFGLAALKDFGASVKILAALPFILFGAYLIISPIKDRIANIARVRCNSCGKYYSFKLNKETNGSLQWLNVEKKFTADEVVSKSSSEKVVIGSLNSFSLIRGDATLNLLEGAIEIEGLTNKETSKEIRKLINIAFYIPTLVIGIMLCIYVSGPLFSDVFAHLRNFNETSNLFLSRWEKSMHPVIMAWNFFMFAWQFILVYFTPFLITGLVVNEIIRPLRRKHGVRIKLQLPFEDITEGVLVTAYNRLVITIKKPDKKSQTIRILNLSPRLIKRLMEYLPEVVLRK